MLEQLQLGWNSYSGAIVLVVAILNVIVVALANLLKVRGVPGPKLYALTRWRLAYDDWRGIRTRTIHHLHQNYGPVVRISPNEISFNSLSALKTIYGAGSGFERTSFYRMFDAYGHQNLFTFASPKDHGERKKLLNHAYSKSSILKVSAADIEGKAWEYMQLLETEPDMASEIFTSLHYYSLDNITHFLYDKDRGATASLTGSVTDRALLDDILDPARRKLSWFFTHFPRYTKWLMSRTGVSEKIVSLLGLLPQKKPTVYTGIRRHALEAWHSFSAISSDEKLKSKSSTIIGRLWENHTSRKETGLQDLEIASETADHLLAGVDTTSDTLMFLIWALSLPKNTNFQEKLIEEVTLMSPLTLDSRGIPTADATGKLPYLDAVIKETLRLYAPLPASEPRSLPVDTVIDGYKIPANTTVSMSPYSLHRNADVFPDSLVFNPERWLGDSKDVAEMKKWFWAFSSGGRMCIGIQYVACLLENLY
jgi:cytochrome P450